MEEYRKNIIKQCVNLLAGELADHLIELLKDELSELQYSSRSTKRTTMKQIRLKKKRPWVKDETERPYKQDPLFKMPPEIFTSDPALSFLKSIGVEQEQFSWLLNRVSPFIQKQDTLMRDALPAHVKLKIVLSYLVVGGSYQQLSNQFQIPKNSISSFLSDVMSTICDALEEFNKIPNTDEKWRSIEKEFKEKYDFPNCYGSLDGKCVQIVSKKLPANTDILKSNHKGNFSHVMLLGLVDANYSFLYVDVEITVQRGQGKQNFERTQLGKALAKNDFGLPSNAIIAANSSFPLKDNLMTPISNPKSKFTNEKDLFNRCMSRILRTNDITFKILCTKFHVLDKSVSLGVDKIPILIKSCCSLHNWQNKTNPSYMGSLNFDSDVDKQLDFGRWCQENSAGRALQDMKTFSSSKSITAIERQNWFINYFSKNNVVPNEKK